MSDMTVYRDVKEMALDVAKSKLFSLGGVEQAVTMMMISQAEGRHPIEGIMRYHIINGKPSKKSDAMLADFQASGGEVEWLVYTDEVVTGRFSHPSSPVPVTITWNEEAVKKAGLSGGNHAKYPRAMKRARVISEGVRTCYPMATGLLYVPEEVEGFSEPIREVKTIQSEPVKVLAHEEIIEPKVEPKVEPVAESVSTPKVEREAIKTKYEDLAKAINDFGITDKVEMLAHVNNKIGKLLISVSGLNRGEVEYLIEWYRKAYGMKCLLAKGGADSEEAVILAVNSILISAGMPTYDRIEDMELEHMDYVCDICGATL